MLIYGWKAAHLKSAESRTIICPKCETKGSLSFSVFSKHAHVFWIPLFPFGKTGSSHCTHCKHTMEAKEMPHEIRKEYDSLKSQTKAPIWQFSGTALILILIVYGVMISEETQARELGYMEKPVVGDIYRYKTENDAYSTLKLVKISDDSLFVSPNDYEISKMSKVYSIDKEENYPDFNYGISKMEFKNMCTEEVIYSIDRK